MWMSSISTDQRLAPRHPLDELDDSLVEAHSLEIGGDRGPGRALGAETLLDVEARARRVRRPGSIRRRQLELLDTRSRISSAHRPSGATPPRSSAAHAAGRAPVGSARGRCSSSASRVLPIPGSPVIDRDATAAGAGQLPALLEGAQLAVAADKRERPEHGRHLASVARLETAVAELIGQLPVWAPRATIPSSRRSRSRSSSYSRERAAAVAGGRESRHQPPVGGLVEPVERDLAARQPNRALVMTVALGLDGQRLERLGDAIAISSTRFKRPFLVEPRQQLALAQRKRILQLTFSQPLLELGHVDPKAIGTVERDLLARGHDKTPPRTERPP